MCECVCVLCELLGVLIVQAGSSLPDVGAWCVCVDQANQSSHQAECVHGRLAGLTDLGAVGALHHPIVPVEGRVVPVCMSKDGEIDGWMER
jgi:hypothetical protein